MKLNIFLKTKLLSLFVIMVVCISSANLAKAQLLTNGNFESYTECPYAYNNSQIAGDPMGATGWVKAAAVATPDYSNKNGDCEYAFQDDTSANSIANFGTKRFNLPTSGIRSGVGSFAYMGFLLSNTGAGQTDYAEYIQHPLTSPLIAGKTYTLTFLAARAGEDDITPQTTFGAVFSPTALRHTLTGLNSTLITNWTNANGVGYNSSTMSIAESTIAQVVALNNTSWQTVTLTFVAKGGEQYITMGALSHPTTGTNKNSYIAVDDIVLAPECSAGTAQVPVTSNISIPCGASTVNLATAHTGAAPGVSSLVWFTTANRSTTALTAAEAAAAGPGTYYAFYYDATANCYNTATSTSAVTVSSSGCGYIYLHHQATNEEGSPNFTYTLTGGGARDFILNDQTDFLSSEDLGASQSGRLWALARTVSDATFNNWKIYYRDLNSATWTAITTLGSPRAIDGGIGSTAIYSTNASSGTTGRVYSIAADGTTTDITGNLPGGIVYDVSDNWLAFGSGGRQYASVQNGNIYQRTTSALPAVWTVVANSPSHRVDAVPKTNNLYYVVGNSTTAGSTVFYRDVTAGSSINLGTASNTDDIAITENGTVIAGYKKMNGTPGGTVTWTDDVQGMYGFNVTGGPNDLFWSSVGITNVNNGNTAVRPNRIMTRTAAGTWIDDERIRATGTHNDNSVLLSLSPGTYRITEDTEPSGWRLQSIFADPTVTTDVATKSATITVVANSTTNLVFSNVNDIAFAMPTDCTTGFTENFGTTEANYAAPTISSAYHNGAPTLNGTSASAMGYGYYGLIKNSNLITGDLASGGGVEYTTGFTDHTSGTGRMLGINATGQPRIFYQKRITGLTIGTAYNYSVWVRSADINAGSLPNVGLQVLNPTTGAILFSNSSGTIANANPPAAWRQVTLNFTATTNSIDLALASLTAGAWGNDFAVDDISLLPAKPTAPIVGTITQPTCTALGSVALSGLPATGTWTITDTNGGATMTGTGTTATFVNLATGNHTFTVALGAGCASNPSATVTINAQPVIPTTPVIGTITQPTCAVPTGSVALSGLPSGAWTITTVPATVSTAGSGATTTITGLPAGATYKFIVTSTTSTCSSTASADAIINAAPAPVVNPGAITGPACIQSPFTGSYSVTNVPGTTYNWTYSGTGAGGGISTGQGTSNITLTFSESITSGTLSVTATNGCGTSTASTLNIIVLGKPSIATLGESTICPGGGSVILTSTPAPAYQWYKDGVLIPGATNQNYTAVATGAYSVITSFGSCTSMSSDMFNVLQQDTTPPVFVSPLGTTSKNVKIDFRNVSTTPINLPRIFNNIETGALANERVKISQSTGVASSFLDKIPAASFPATASATAPVGPAAYGNANVLQITNVGDPIRTLTLNFDQSVTNLKFSLFEIDGISKVEARAYNNGSSQSIGIVPLRSTTPNVNVSASPSTTPLITAPNGGYSYSNITQTRTAGVNVDVAGPVNSFVLATTTRFNGDQDISISQISYDYTSPIMPADITVNCDAIPAPLVFTATDNCSAANVTYTQVPAVYTPSSSTQIITRTWVATDSSGNTSSYTQTITINPGSAMPTAAASQNICATNYSTLANIAITGTNIKWYEDGTTTTALPSTTLLTNGSTYYATQTLSGNCESSRVPITVQLRNCSWINPSLRLKGGK
ncbi:beta strand repeat-containing protein [Epilithonimonas xixisoli]|uniref:PKD-like domain-containing protein n=1 Tax=Epilithonimonas xixisoli TaxID=1476462 RepID=A0A4R8IK02_9FLAO|nr:hypothetical protein [Epilithonimonas xixisoli]TDX87245.1 hypothetical protein B0I22_1433 [Epilithonimonas xixisoli]